MNSTNDESIEAKITALSAKVDSLILGYKVGGLALLFLFSLFNVGDTFAISHFRQIFADALPGKTFPALTNFFLGHQTLVTCVAVLLPALGLVAAFSFRKVSRTMIVTSLLMILVLLQIALNWIALFTPLISLTSNISDQT
jgi:hypothetical protein